MISLCFGSLLFSLFFVFSFTFHPFSYSPADPLYVFSSRQKNSRIDGLSCFRWRTLMSPLFTAFVSSLHRFRDCLRLPALVVPFGMSKNEFSSLLFLVSSLRPLPAVFCLLLCNRHSSFCLRAFIIVFTHFVFRPLCYCFITGILLCNFFFCVILRIFSVSFFKVGFSTYGWASSLLDHFSFLTRVKFISHNKI